MEHPTAEIELQCARMIDYSAAVVGAESLRELGDLHMLLIRSIDAQMEKLYERFEPKDTLSTAESYLHIQDAETGRVYPRELPMDYHENNNGISIHGESLQGEPQSIAFLSAQAIEKIVELTGHGLNKPRCHEEEA